MAAKAAAVLNESAAAHLRALAPAFAAMGDWTEEAAEAAVKAYADSRGVKLGEVAQPLRAALTGQTQSPGLFEVMIALGKEEALARLADAAK
jgi:glutamyl-tRNA synthetase